VRLARRDDESWQRYGEEVQRRQPRKDAADTFAQVRFTTPAGMFPVGGFGLETGLGGQ
jgi:hypothetical protein